MAAMTPNPNTQIVGIFQSDIILKSAIESAFELLRGADSWALDYVLAGLLQDKITSKTYGQNEIDQLKSWFINTDINVLVTPNMNEFKLPAVSITLLESTEIESTLADVHAFPRETIPTPVSPNLSETFSGTYNPSTGFVVVPSNIDFTPFYPGMYLTNNQGNSYQIIDVVGDGTVNIGANLQPNLQSVSLQARAGDAWVVDVESTKFKESYRLGVFCDSEPDHLLLLWSLVVFALTRYRQVLLEHRGIERTSITSATLERLQEVSPENCYMRFVMLSCVTTAVWPKYRFPAIQGLSVNEIPVALEIDENTQPF